MADYMQKTEWLLQEILVRVPGKDLANSKLVCKDWYNLIKSPNFVSAYYNHHIHSQEDEPVPGLLKKDNKRKSNWDDEDLDDNDMKDSSEEEEDEPTPAPKTEPMPTKKAHKKTASETVEKKRKRFEALKEAPLDPVEEKLCQQRLDGEADYKSTAELFGKMGDEKTLDNFIPKSESDFMEYAELVAHKLRPYEKNYHYIGLLKAVMRLSMVSLTGSDATDVASSITAIVNEKIKVEMEANAGKKKTEDESVPNLLKMDYKLKSNWDDEDLDDNDVKDSREEEDEPALAPKTEPMTTEKASAEGKIRKIECLLEDEEAENIVEAILLRVPPKDIIRCKLVSKYWCDLIESPDFLSAHYKHHFSSQEDDEGLDDNDVKDSWVEEDEPALAPKTELMPTEKVPQKTVAKTVEKKGNSFEAVNEAPLDPVEEKLRQQRLVGEADYKSTAELFGKMGDEKTLDNFIPKSEGDFTEYAELVADKLRSYEKSYHYIGLLKAVMRLSMVSITGSDAKVVASSITAIVNEKIKVEKEVNAGKKTEAVGNTNSNQSVEEYEDCWDASMREDCWDASMRALTGGKVTLYLPQILYDFERGYITSNIGSS